MPTPYILHTLLLHLTHYTLHCSDALHRRLQDAKIVGSRMYSYTHERERERDRHARARARAHTHTHTHTHTQCSGSRAVVREAVNKQQTLIFKMHNPGGPHL